MMSFISRFNYSYKSKYLATATFRADGSSRFGSNNRWGNFPSFSVGYNISEESFMKSLTTINNLKIRASYGLSGNNLIGNYAAIGLLSPAYYVEGEKKVPGLNPSSLSNDDLTWEISKQFNLGLELGLFEDRISIVADIYKNKKTDLLLAVQLPAASGFTTSTQNIGDIENKGIELALNTINVKSQDFNWSSNIVFSANENKVVKLTTESDRIIMGSYQVTEVGYPIGSFYLIKQLGIFQNSAEVAASAVQHPKVQAGDIKFDDYSGDGKLINSEDKQIVGDPWPDFTWGFNNKFKYKNVSLVIDINGVQGAQTYFMAGINGGLTNSAAVQNQLAVLDPWISESDPGDGVTPRPIRNNYAMGLSDNSRNLYDASYIRIRNINLSYDIPSRISSKLSISNLTVYGNISNVYTFTDYPGYDPESSSAGNNILSSGIDQLSYPLARTYTIGLKLLF
jgi:TonB-linked SusC/RagA family outer membrane protein